jgi:hypothetical protein
MQNKWRLYGKLSIDYLIKPERADYNKNEERRSKIDLLSSFSILCCISGLIFPNVLNLQNPEWLRGLFNCSYQRSYHLPNCN